MSAKQAINDKLQGSVGTYLRCGGVVNNQIKKDLLLSVWVKKTFKSVNIWQSYKQERGCLMHFARLANTYAKRGRNVIAYRYETFSFFVAYFCWSGDMTHFVTRNKTTFSSSQ